MVISADVRFQQLLVLVLVTVTHLAATHRGMINNRPRSHRRIHGPGPVTTSSGSPMQQVQSKKMKMLLGMCQEDRQIQLKSLPQSSPLASSLPNPTPEQITENTIDDMVDVMTKVSEEEGTHDPLMDNLMTEMKELTTMMQVETRTGNQSPNETAKSFEDRVRELLSASGIEALLPLDCGRNPLSPTAPLGKEPLPWVAALGSREDGRFHYRCTGALITNHHILTDADCASSPNINIVQLNITGLIPEPFAVENYVVGRRIHPSIRDKEDLLNGSNIGILELALPVFFNDYVQPICLPGVFDNPDPLTSETGTVVGFNDIVDTPQGRLASLYAFGNSSLLGSSLCYTVVRLRNERFQQQSTLYSILTENHICVSRIFEQIGKSILVQEDSVTNRVKLLGVGGIANAQVSNPIAYTLVQKHRFWVELVLKKFMDNVMDLASRS